ncbi:MAG: hypothetical protein M3533_14425 [Actinomycetota bacterium]|nr:hypothetical protein [Actinomycetota bacterium]
MRLYALLESLWELLFTGATVAEDGTVVRRTVIRPARGLRDPVGLA